MINSMIVYDKERFQILFLSFKSKFLKGEYKSINYN